MKIKGAAGQSQRLLHHYHIESLAKFRADAGQATDFDIATSCVQRERSCPVRPDHTDQIGKPLIFRPCAQGSQQPSPHAFAARIAMDVDGVFRRAPISRPGAEAAIGGVAE